MKLVFKKMGYPGGSFTLLPRAVFDSEEEEHAKGTLSVSLSRKGGECVFQLDSLDEHDSHAPGWNADGTAPQNSSAPDVTADQYKSRIVNAVTVALGANPTEVKIIEETIEPSEENENAPDNVKADEDWKKYGIN